MPSGAIILVVTRSNQAGIKGLDALKRARRESFRSPHELLYSTGAVLSACSASGGMGARPYLTMMVNVLTLLAEGDSRRKGGGEDRLLGMQRWMEK